MEAMRNHRESYDTEGFYDPSGESEKPEEGIKPEGVCTTGSGICGTASSMKVNCGIFEKYLNRIDNYGFLLSEYKSPEYLDLNEVFIQGAGMDQPAMTGKKGRRFSRQWDRRR